MCDLHSPHTATHCAVQERESHSISCHTHCSPVATKGACVGAAVGETRERDVVVGLPRVKPLFALKAVRKEPLSTELRRFNRTSLGVSLVMRPIVYVTDTLDSKLRLLPDTIKLVMTVSLSPKTSLTLCLIAAAKRGVETSSRVTSSRSCEREGGRERVE